MIYPMRIALAVALLLALTPTASALTERKGREVTADFGQWGGSDYKVGECWHRAEGAVRCRLKERVSIWGLPEGWLTTKVHVTRRDGRLCARDTLYDGRPKKYDCR